MQCLLLNIVGQMLTVIVVCCIRTLRGHFMLSQMLASRVEEPQEMTIEYLNVIHDLFTFYHQSVSRILKVYTLYM